jgi:hypothetical protein
MINIKIIVVITNLIIAFVEKIDIDINLKKV